MLFARVRSRVTRFVFCSVLCAAVLAGLLPLAATAQDAAAPAKPVTFLGTVQTLSGNSITVKNDAGATMQVTVEDNARLLRIEPGQKTLAGASPFSLSDLQAGDRVMARGSANPDGKSLAANMLVAIKGADIAQKQEHEREDWQKNGTGGLVKAVDAAAGTVTISTGTGATRTLVIHVTPTTVIRRYAPGSVKFDQAVKSTVDQIKPGDQLRARGPKGADGATLDAVEIVGGNFLNLAGAIQAVNADASTITLTDAATKKPVVITVTPDSEVKRLDPAVAQRIAARLSGAKGPGGAAGGPSSGSSSGSGAAGAGSAPGAGGPGASGGDHPAGGPRGPGAGPGGGGPDFQQVLARAPSVTLKDLQKGNMIIVVATEGQSPQSATAITVVAGVEPMLQASTSGSQAMLSSSWNLGGGGGGEGGGGGGGEAPQ
jgi:Cu/Ag efflux protein CusF